MSEKRWDNVIEYDEWAAFVRQIRRDRVANEAREAAERERLKVVAQGSDRPCDTEGE